MVTTGTTTQCHSPEDFNFQYTMPTKYWYKVKNKCWWTHSLDSKLVDVESLDLVKGYLEQIKQLNHTCVCVWSQFMWQTGLYLYISTNSIEAFDCLHHDILIEKFTYYGVNKPDIHWFRSHLLNHKQRVNINIKNVQIYNSKWNTVSLRIPQGSVLGPLFFILYINNLPKMLTTSAMLSYLQTIQVF